MWQALRVRMLKYLIEARCCRCVKLCLNCALPVSYSLLLSFSGITHLTIAISSKPQSLADYCLFGDSQDLLSGDFGMSVRVNTCRLPGYCDYLPSIHILR